MKKALWIALTLALGLCLLSAPAVWAQDAAVTINGEVYNGTDGGELPEGQPVTLHVYADGALSATYQAEAGLDGAFSFELPELVEGDQVIAATSYQNISYTSPAFIYASGQEIPDLSIAVYETTEDSSHIVVSQMTVMLNASEGQLRVGEYYLLSNFGDRTWVGSFDDALGVRTTSRISLTSEAESLWFSGGDLGDRFYSGEDGIIDTAPVIPGAPSAEIFFSYAVPYAGEFEFFKVLNLPVESAGFLVAEGSGIAVEGEGILFNETIDTDTEAALSYVGPAFSAGQPLNFTVVDQKSGASSSGWEVGIGVLSLAAAAAGIFGVLRKGRKAHLPQAADPFLGEIAVLDDAYAAGQVPEGQYLQERRDLVEKIKRLAKGK